MNVVLNLDEQTIKALIRKFSSYQIPSKSQYVRFMAKLSGASVAVYTSGKVVFQGANAEKLAGEFGYHRQEVSLEQADCIGTDEVGNGSYFGSLVVVATYIDADAVALVKELGVADSKKLTDEKIRQIAPDLMEALPHVALVVEPAKYNEVIEKGYNAVSIKVALHNQAIFLLEKKLGYEPRQIVIDAFTSASNYEKYVKAERHQVSMPVTLLPKAEDQFLAVAASSVIARALFLKNLDELSQTWKVTIPSGAGAKSDVVAAQIITEHGFEALNQLVKLHFANTNKALRLAKNRK